MTKLEKAEKAVYVILMAIGGVFMLSAMGVVAVNVVYRAIFSAPIKGYYELTGWLSAYFCAIAIPVTTLRKQHVRVDIITSRMPAKIQLVLEYFVHAVDMALAGFIFFAAYRYAARMFAAGEATQTLRFPIWPARFVWTLAMLLIIVIKVIQIARTKREWLEQQQQIQADQAGKEDN